MCRYPDLKSATALSLKRNGPLEKINVRLDKGTLSRAANEHEPNYLPIDVAVDLDLLSGDPVILRAMANRLGYTIVPKPRQTTSSIQIESAHFAKEAGELTYVAITAASDGVISTNEHRQIYKEAEEVIERAEAIMAGAA